MQDRVRSDRRTDERRAKKISVEIERRANQRRSGLDRRAIASGQSL